MPYKITAPTAFTGMQVGDEQAEWFAGTRFVRDDAAADLAYYRRTDSGYQVERVDSVDAEWAEGVARLRARSEHLVGTPWVDAADPGRVEPRADLLSQVRLADQRAGRHADYSAATAAIIANIEGTI